MSTTSGNNSGDRPEAVETLQTGQAGMELSTKTPPVPDITITTETHPNDEQAAKLWVRLERALESNEQLIAQAEDARAQYTALEAMIGQATTWAAGSGQDKDYVPMLEERVRARATGLFSSAAPAVTQRTQIKRMITRVTTTGAPWFTPEMSQGDRKHFAATITSVLLEYLDAICAADGDRSNARYPASRWDAWFGDGFNPTSDYGIDPRLLTATPAVTEATYGLSMDASRAPRGGQAWCRAEAVNSVSQFIKRNQKQHFQSWTIPAAVNLMQDVCKSVHALFSAVSATARVWSSMLPGNHPKHRRAVSLTTEAHMIANIIKGYLFAGRKMREDLLLTTSPCIVFAANVNAEWMVVAIMNQHTVAPIVLPPQQ
ncbi:hypothetical protein HDU86_005470 [Geranomyces michiganensis]|nr:hypothetical protein HDU86_005470 [Geranomyces michiganensis]